MLILRKILGLAALYILLGAPTAVFAGAYEDYFNAVKKNDDVQVKALLQRGLDPNIVEAERGDSGLILALRENAGKVFNLLLNTKGIDLELKINNGDNALMIAAHKANKEAVAALLARKVEVNRPGWTALHYAAYAGSEDIVRMLLDKGAALDARSPNNTTPIMMAAWGGHIMTVKLLLDQGADATLKNDVNMTAMDFARSVGRTDIADGLTYRLKRAGKLQ
jgi:ankyrin repeat protein